MPKKFKGENSKAQEARARKAAQKEEETMKKTKAAEDEYWRDDDKHIARKQQRKGDKEKKRLEALEKKKEREELEQQELSNIKSAKPALEAKVTRAEIAKKQEDMATAAAVAAKKAEGGDDSDTPIEENLNRLTIEGEARNVDEAIAVLSEKDSALDKHPEKRMKAAFKAYEEVNLPRLKEEHPNLRLSQIKQILKKDWMKSPENPMVQRLTAAS